MSTTHLPTKQGHVEEEEDSPVAAYWKRMIPGRDPDPLAEKKAEIDLKAAEVLDAGDDSAEVRARSRRDRAEIAPRRARTDRLTPSDEICTTRDYICSGRSVSRRNMRTSRR